MGKRSENGRQLSFDRFTKILRHLMDSRGMINKDLADAVETTPATISRYTTGMRDPEVEYLYRISKYFGVTIDFLLGLTDVKNSVFTDDADEVAYLYSFASERDRELIKTILKKYSEKDEEQ